MAASAKWRGAADARKAFARLPEVVRNQINEATSQTAMAVQAGAKARAPVRTGLLRRSIKRSMDKRRGAAKVRATAPHAHLVEFGTVRMSARPFLLPAAEAERHNYIARAREAGSRIERDMAKGT